MVDPGFSREGCANYQKRYYFSIFLPKTAWKTKNLNPAGARLLAPPWIRQWKVLSIFQEDCKFSEY